MLTTLLVPELRSFSIYSGLVALSMIKAAWARVGALPTRSLDELNCLVDWSLEVIANRSQIHSQKRIIYDSMFEARDLP